MGNRGIGVLKVVLVILSGLILFAIVVPGFMRTCACGEEVRAIGALRSINAAQAAYAESCADAAYAPTLEDLRRPPLAGGVEFLSQEGPYLPGYKITISAGPALPGASCNGGRRTTGYFAEVHPTGSNAGQRFFATDEHFLIYESDKPITAGMAGARLLQ